MKIRRIVPNINSTRMEESRKFYGEFLGLDMVMDMEWVMTFASASNPTAQVTIVKTEEAGSNSGAWITVEVEDVDNAYQLAVSSGYEIPYPVVDEDWGVRRFFVKDPNGVTVNIMSHRTEGMDKL